MYPLPPSILFLFVFAFSASALFGQSHAIEKMDLGKSQNTAQDFANSLDPGPPKYGKGEKRAEVDPKKLESKRSNDTLFAGGLNDVSVDWKAKGMGKPRTEHDAESHTAKTSSAVEKESKVTLTLETTAAAQTKEQTSATSAKTEDKSSDKAKTSTGKTDADR